MAVLDTNVLIDLRDPPASARRQRAQAFLLPRVRAGETLFTTRLNQAELLVGVHRSKDPVAETEKVAEVLALAGMLEFDETAADRFGQIQAHLLSVGRPIGDMDALIAAIALANGQSLVTRNARHFADIPGLVVESY